MRSILNNSGSDSTNSSMKLSPCFWKLVSCSVECCWREQLRNFVVAFKLSFYKQLATCLFQYHRYKRLCTLTFGTVRGERTFPRPALQALPPDTSRLVRSGLSLPVPSWDSLGESNCCFVSVFSGTNRLCWRCLLMEVEVVSATECKEKLSTPQTFVGRAECSKRHGVVTIVQSWVVKISTWHV